MKNYNDKYFSNLYCCDNILLSRKKCAFYWCYQDYFGEYDEKCYVCDMKHQSKLLCYLPYVIQKIILKIHNRRMGKEYEKTLEQYDKEMYDGLSEYLKDEIKQTIVNEEVSKDEAKNLSSSSNN